MFDINHAVWTHLSFNDGTKSNDGEQYWKKKDEVLKFMIYPHQIVIHADELDVL